MTTRELMLCGTMLGLAAGAFAANPASDDATDSVYNSGWTNGMNGGVGFGPWTLTRQGEGGGNDVSFFRAQTNSYATLNYIGSGWQGRAWGMSASGTKTNKAVAMRALAGLPLVWQQTFALSMENSRLTSTGQVGFTLRHGHDTSGPAAYNSGARFEWGAQGESNYFLIDGSSSGARYDTGVPFTTNGLRFRFALTGGSAYSLEVVSLGPTVATNAFAGRTLQGSGGIESFALYLFDGDVSGADGYAYFNTVAVEGAVPPSPYTLEPAAFDGGGLRLTNGNCAIDTTVGGVMGWVTNGPERTLKIGYAAQLYDRVGLIATANPANVDEGDTSQLAAQSLCDDDTRLPLAGTPEWTVLSGPVASITEGGLAQTTNVYANTPADVQAANGGYTDVVALLVMNVGNDDYLSYAGDGLPDDWQAVHFGEENPDAAPGADPDGDAMPNSGEYAGDTIPTNPASLLAITFIAAVDGGVAVDWKGGQQATQYLDRAITLPATDPDAWVCILTNLPPTTPTESHVDAANDRVRFYRVRAAR